MAIDKPIGKIGETVHEAIVPPVLVKIILLIAVFWIATTAEVFAISGACNTVPPLLPPSLLPPSLLPPPLLPLSLLVVPPDVIALPVSVVPEDKSVTSASIPKLALRCSSASANDTGIIPDSLSNASVSSWVISARFPDAVIAISLGILIAVVRSPSSSNDCKNEAILRTSGLEISSLSTPTKSCGYIFPSIVISEMEPITKLPTLNSTGIMLHSNLPSTPVVPITSPHWYAIFTIGASIRYPTILLLSVTVSVTLVSDTVLFSTTVFTTVGSLFLSIEEEFPPHPIIDKINTIKIKSFNLNTIFLLSS